MAYKYYIGCSDYFGDNQAPDKIFNEEVVPYLESLNLTEDEIKKVYRMVSRIADEAWANGEECARIDD